MAMVHLRVICPPDLVAEVAELLTDRVGVVAVTRGDSSHGPVVTADLARESVEGVLSPCTESTSATSA